MTRRSLFSFLAAPLLAPLVAWFPSPWTWFRTKARMDPYDMDREIIKKRRWLTKVLREQEIACLKLRPLWMPWSRGPVE